MNLIYEQLANPYFAAFVAGVATFAVMYIDGKISNKEVTKKSYTKNILFVALLCGTIVYILANTIMHPKIVKIAASASAATASTASTATAALGAYDTSDIFIGEPKF